MQSFLEETWQHLQTKVSDPKQLCIVVPSIRAGNFLRQLIARQANGPQFIPEIVSIVEFIQRVADLSLLNQTSLLFELYKVYTQTHPEEPKDSFDSFVNWAPTLLGDFNEIDRYLVNPKAFFGYLESIQDLNHWIMEPEKSPMIENYLSFWRHLYAYYSEFTSHLLSKGVGYQGMIYRESAEHIEHYMRAHPDRMHAFLGFNALNNSEQHLMQEFVARDRGLIYWDADSHFMEQPDHSASHFMRSYFKAWRCYQQAQPLFINNNYSSNKSFNLVETSNALSQVKYAGQVLSSLSSEQLSATAVVLADESLLIPLLNSLPENVKNVNVTMGVSLKSSPLSQWLLMLIGLPLNEKMLYYKDLFKVLSNPISRQFLSCADPIMEQIGKNNQVVVSLEQLLAMAPDKEAIALKLLLSPWPKDTKAFIDRLRRLLVLSPQKNPLFLSTQKAIDSVLDQLQIMHETYPELLLNSAFVSILEQQLGSQSLDFHGDAYRGLQIMGVLETRLLDYQRVIMLSVNEGKLPAGKNIASFITADLKKQFGLPSYYEKDAVFTYHFYRLLHRVKEAHLVYINSQDGLDSNEKSRLLLQIENDALPQHSITKAAIVPEFVNKEPQLFSVSKSPETLSRIKEIAQKGFSPSALTNYIRNPIDFYTQRMLRIEPDDGVEETIAYNTLGTIVHQTIEVLYLPFVKTRLTAENLKAIKKSVKSEVALACKEVFKSDYYLLGKIGLSSRWLSNTYTQP